MMVSLHRVVVEIRGVGGLFWPPCLVSWPQFVATEGAAHCVGRHREDPVEDFPEVVLHRETLAAASLAQDGNPVGLLLSVVEWPKGSCERSDRAFDNEGREPDLHVARAAFV